MKKLVIFSRKYTIIEHNSDRDSLRLKNHKIFITSCKRPASSLLKEFLVEHLYSQLLKIYGQIKNEGKVEVFGNLDFKVVDKIDNKKRRVAKIKGNKILVKLNAIALPKSTLKYIIAHELAHTLTKRHSERFWKITRTIYPNFKRGQKLFMTYGKFLCKPLNLNVA